MIDQPIARVTRGEWTESSHYGHIAVVDTQGRVVAHWGDPERETFVRSCAKPLQAVPVVASGAAAAYGFAVEDLALLCASHSGEDRHAEGVLAILRKIGCSPEDLQCGVHPPFDRATANEMLRQGRDWTPLRHNCSGKHSGMLALARRLGADTEGYWLPSHPVQQAMRAAVAEISGVPELKLRLATDGCGVPVFGMPLSRLAFAYARFATGEGLRPETAAACGALAAAMRRHPELVAGTDRYDTILMREAAEPLIGKMGAEGVFAVAVPGRGLGLACKIEDGNPRALYPAVTEALRQLGALSDPLAEPLAKAHMPTLPNAKGEQVGRIIPDFRLSMAPDGIPPA